MFCDPAPNRFLQYRYRLGRTAGLVHRVGQPLVGLSRAGLSPNDVLEDRNRFLRAPVTG